MVYRLFILFILYTFAQSQSFEKTIINGGSLFTTACAVQDFDQDDDLDIIILREKAGQSPAALEWLENEDGRFERHEISIELGQPNDIKMADFDNNGLTDYLIADKGLSLNLGEVAIFLRQQDDSFIKQTILSDSGYYQTAVADFDSNGFMDFVTVGFSLKTVAFYLNDGNMGFSRSLLEDSVNQVDLVEADDIDEDGDTDIVFGAGNNFKLYYNNGNAVFDSSKILYTWGGNRSSASAGLIIKDLDGDNRKDILTYSGIGTGGLYFLDGSEDFQPLRIDHEGIDLGGDLLIADLDNNGMKDIVRQQISKKTISVLYQIDSLTFLKEFIEYNWDNSTNGGPPQMTLGDLDNDGDQDLILPEKGNIDGDLSWYENIQGKLFRHLIFGEIQSVRTSKEADIDLDGDIDIVLAAGGASPSPVFQEDEIIWYENKGNDNFLEHRIADSIKYPADIGLVDINNDDTLEVVVTANLENKVMYYKKSGPDWLRYEIDDSVTLPFALELADVDSDQDQDIIISSGGDSSLFWYENENGLFQKHHLPEMVADIRQIKAIDIDLNQTMDLISVSNDTHYSVVLFKNDGNENFEKDILLSGLQVNSLDTGDWDNNSYPDIVIGVNGNINANNINTHLLKNTGLGTFIDTVLVTLSDESGIVRLIDIDFDNDPDLIYSNRSGLKGLNLAMNNNGQIDTAFVIEENKLQVFGMSVNDFNNDGAMDIIVSDQEKNDLLLYKGSLVSSLTPGEKNMIGGYRLAQNYPNPFNPGTVIQYYLPEQTYVKLEIFDVSGRRIKSYINKKQNAGHYSLNFNGNNHSSGIYFYKLSAKSFTKTLKMILIK